MGRKISDKIKKEKVSDSGVIVKNIDNCLYQVQRIYGTREHTIIKLN